MDVRGMDGERERGTTRIHASVCCGDGNSAATRCSQPVCTVEKLNKKNKCIHLQICCHTTYSNTQTIFYLCSIIWCWYGNVRLGQGCFCFCDRPSGRFSDVRRIAALNFISFFSLVHFVVVVAQSLVCTASLIPLCVRVCVFVSDAVLCIWNERYIFSSCYFIYISVGDSSGFWSPTALGQFQRTAKQHPTISINKCFKWNDGNHRSVLSLEFRCIQLRHLSYPRFYWLFAIWDDLMIALLIFFLFCFVFSMFSVLRGHSWSMIFEWPI